MAACLVWIRAFRGVNCCVSYLIWLQLFRPKLCFTDWMKDAHFSFILALCHRAVVVVSSLLGGRERELQRKNINRLTKYLLIRRSTNESGCDDTSCPFYSCSRTVFTHFFLNKDNQAHIVHPSPTFQVVRVLTTSLLFWNRQRIW